MFRDSFGLIVTKTGDGGDTARREWCFWLANYWREKLQLEPKHSVNNAKQTIALLEASPGVIVRHPDPLKWYSKPDKTSRDQTLGAFIIGQIYDKEFLSRLVDAHKKRFWLCSNNTDNLWFSWSVITRARGKWFSLYLTDWFFLFDLLVIFGWLPKFDDGTKKLRWYDPDNTGPDWNFVLALTQPGHETFIRKLVRWLYGQYRPLNNGNTHLKEWHPVAGALIWESRVDCPELAEMWRPLCYEFFPRWGK